MPVIGEPMRLGCFASRQSLLRLFFVCLAACASGRTRVHATDLAALEGKASADETFSEAQTLTKIRADATQAGVRCVREFWIVNTRCAPACRGLEAGFDQITYSKYEPGRGWVRYPFPEFLAGVDASLPTTIFVHGNLYTHPEAVSAMFQTADIVGRGVPAFRIILWSWDSQFVRGVGLIGSVRAKAARSESQGYYLARLIEQLDPQVSLSLVGHSFGARTVAAALEGLATHRVAGHELPPRTHDDRRSIQVAMLAAAVDNTALLPGRRYGSALTQVDRLLLTVNSRDLALRAFTRFANGGGPVLGLTGLPNIHSLGDQRSKIRVVYSPLGCKHEIKYYEHSPSIVAAMRPYFFQPISPTTAPALTAQAE